MRHSGKMGLKYLVPLIKIRKHVNVYLQLNGAFADFARDRRKLGEIPTQDRCYDSGVVA